MVVGIEMALLKTMDAAIQMADSILMAVLGQKVDLTLTAGMIWMSGLKSTAFVNQRVVLRPKAVATQTAA